MTRILVVLALLSGACEKKGRVSQPNPWDSPQCWPLRYINGRPTHKWCHFQGWKWECVRNDFDTQNEQIVCDRRDALSAEQSK